MFPQTHYHFHNMYLGFKILSKQLFLKKKNSNNYYSTITFLIRFVSCVFRVEDSIESNNSR